MGVPAEDLDRDIGAKFPDRLVDQIERGSAGVAPGNIMTGEDEQINGLRKVHGIDEPVLSHHRGSRGYLSNVCVGGEIEYNPKSHDAHAWRTSALSFWGMLQSAHP